jgi:hypothetical protein
MALHLKRSWQYSLLYTRDRRGPAWRRPAPTAKREQPLRRSKHRDKQCSGLRHWHSELSSRSHYNVFGVALANKLARIAWARTRQRRYLSASHSGRHD